MTDDQIQIPFAGGPNETLDPRSLPPGSVIALQNVNYDQEGMFQTRFGYTELGALGSAPLAVRRLAVFQNELLANDGATMWSWRDGASIQAAGSWVNRDIVPQLQTTHSPLNNSSTSFQSWAEATGNGYRIVAWADTTTTQNIYCAVYSIATGALLLGPIQPSGLNGANVTVGVVGTTAIVTTINSTTVNILGCSLALSPLGTWGGVFSLNDVNLVATQVYAVAYMSATFAISYQNGASGASQTVRTLLYDATFSRLTNVNGPNTTLTGPFVAIGSRGTTGEVLWVSAGSISGTPGVETIALNPSTLAAITGMFAAVLPSNLSGGPVSLSNLSAIAIERVTGSRCLVTIDLAQSTTWAVMWAHYSTTGGTLGVSSGALGVGLASAPQFVSSANTTVAFLRSGPALFGVPSSYFLVDLQSGTTTPAVMPVLLGLYAPLIANLSAFPNPQPPRISSPSSGNFETVLPIARAIGGRQGIELFQIATAPPSAWSSAPLGKALHVGGQRYDGRVLVENGFAVPPQIATFTTGTVGTVTRNYCVTWGWIDAQGNLEESAPSPVTSQLTGASPPNNTIVVNCLHLTNKQRTFGAFGNYQAPVYLILYRTQDLATGDTTYYRVTKEPFPANNPNLLNAPTVTYVDTLSDASLTDGTHPVLYTVSGELIHNPPETFTHIVSHKQRIWGIGADQRSVWFSQTSVDGLVPAWSPLQIFTVDDCPEPLLALGSLYDKLFVFSRNRIYVVFGDGPSAAGTGSDLTQPQRLPTSSGCIEPRSIVSTHMGLFFQSQRGIECIGPDLNVSFIGLPVSVTTQTYPICTSAVLCENSSTVRFTFVQNEAIPATGLGVVVIYDLRRSRWTMHYITKGGTPGNVPGAPVEAAVYHPILGYVAAHNDTTAQALVYRENTATDATPWLDFGTYFVPLYVQLAWLKAGDLQGWQRVRRIRMLAQYFDAHGLSFTLDYDYQVANEVHSFSSAVIAALINGAWEQVRIIPANGNSEAIRVTVQTTSPTNPQVNGSGRGAGFSGIAFEVRRSKGGYRKLADAAKG